MDWCTRPPRLSRLCAVAAALTSGCRSPPPPPHLAPAAAPDAALADLAAAIGDAPVVALGEPSHAEGNMFETQARLVAFLHDRLGFTVLAWGAGLWSCETDAPHCG